MEQEETPVYRGRVRKVYPQKQLPSYEEILGEAPSFGSYSEESEIGNKDVRDVDYGQAYNKEDFTSKDYSEEFGDYHEDSFGNKLPFNSRMNVEDLEDERAENSNAAWNLTKSGVRFLGKTALYTVGGIAAGLEGAAEWAVEEIGDAVTGNKVSDGFRNLYDNVANNAVLAGDKWIDENIQVYKTKEYHRPTYLY